MSKRKTSVLVGNWNLCLGENKNKWTVFVENYDDAISKVEIFLHPTFQPNHFILDKGPFQMTRVGWGTFDIDLKVTFIDGKKKKYVHELDFSETPSIKEYTVAVKDLPPKMIMQCLSDDPSLLPAMERKRYELREEKEMIMKQMEEEKEKKKASGMRNSIYFSYEYYKMQHKKGNPTNCVKLSVERGLVKYIKYTAICGNKSWSRNDSKAMEPAKQDRILKYVKEKFSDMDVENDRLLKQHNMPLKLKKHMKCAMAQIDFTVREIVSGGGLDICSRNIKENSELHQKILEVVEFASNLV